THEKCCRRKYAELEEVRARDRQPDHEQFTKERTIEAPDATESVVLLERAPRDAHDECDSAHGDIHERRRNACAEQIETRQAELTVNERPCQHEVRRDRDERNP